MPKVVDESQDLSALDPLIEHDMKRTKTEGSKIVNTGSQPLTMTSAAPRRVSFSPNREVIPVKDDSDCMCAPYFKMFFR